MIAKTITVCVGLTHPCSSAIKELKNDIFIWYQRVEKSIKYLYIFWLKLRPSIRMVEVVCEGHCWARLTPQENFISFFDEKNKCVGSTDILSYEIYALFYAKFNRRNIDLDHRSHQLSPVDIRRPIIELESYIFYYITHDKGTPESWWWFIFFNHVKNM